MKKKLDITELPKIHENECFMFLNISNKYAVSNYGRLYSFASTKFITLSAPKHGKRGRYTIQINNKPITFAPEILAFKHFIRDLREEEYLQPIDGDWKNFFIGNWKVTTVNPKTEDIAGRKIGHLQIISHDPSAKLHKGDTRVYWKCICDCGKTKSIAHNYILGAKNANCGCRPERPNYQTSGHHTIPRWYWMRCRSGAKSRKIEFDLDIEAAYQKFIKQEGKCAYTGAPIIFGDHSRAKAQVGTASLDRIDSSKGYTIDNVQWVHKDINWMKGDLKDMEFINICRNVSNNHIHNLSKTHRILITGAAGFIGTSLRYLLKDHPQYQIDIFEKEDWFMRWERLAGWPIGKILTVLPPLDEYSAVIHLAANSSTTAPSGESCWGDNAGLSQRIVRECLSKNIRLILASSGSVYGNTNKPSLETDKTRPESFYAFTKETIDLSISERDYENIYSLRFFNVYGGLEDSKGAMASVIYKWLTQDISISNPLKLFKSTDDNFLDGEQKRDFIFVDDVCRVILHCLNTQNKGGIFNVGTGMARSWNDIAHRILKARGLDDNLIEYVDMPENIKKHYQNFTQANIDKLRNVLGYKDPFLTLEEGIEKTREWLKVNG